MGDRIIEVNGTLVTSLTVREVAECVRRRKRDRVLSLVVEKPRKWGLGRLLGRAEQRHAEQVQRFVFGGSYPRTLHLTASPRSLLVGGGWACDFLGILFC